MIAILVLNWNGWEDTIECIKSIHQMDFKDYFVIVGDNGSTNDSKKQIVDYCKNNHIPIMLDSLVSEQISHIKRGDIILCDLLINNGFAKGNNLLIKYCRKFEPSYFFLLNNDTEVKPDFMNFLLDFKCKHQDYEVLTPLIPFYYEKNKVWNAGGKLFWGFRKYYYANKPIESIREKDYIDCSFVTGCALFFSEKCLNAERNLFSEAFFFGEDDFELALRLKDERFKQACVLDSVVYHKVSSSTKASPSIKKIYIHYLNRYINIRQHMNRLPFYFWRVINNVYLLYILRKNGFTKDEIHSFIRQLNDECFTLNGVDKDFFERTLGIKNR